MAFSITCLHCATKLKTQAAIPMGRNVMCPKCKKAFPVTADNMEEAGDSKMSVPATTAKAAAKPAPAAAKKSAAAPAENPFGFDDAPAPKSRRDDDDEEQARPAKARSRRDGDDDDEAPRAKKKPLPLDDEDDDRPRKKRRDDDDEVDDTPRSKKRRDDDDDDRPRRARDDDDDDYERPRGKNGKKKKKGSGLGLKIGLAIAGVLALAGIGFLAWYLLSGGSGAGTFDEDIMALLPADTNNIKYINIERMLSFEKAKAGAEQKFKSEIESEIGKDSGLTIDSIKGILEAKTENGQEFTVIYLRSAADRTKLTSGGSETKVGSKSYWKKKVQVGETFISFHNDSTLIVTQNEENMKSGLSREQGKLAFGADMQNLAKTVAGGDTWSARINKGAGDVKGTGERVNVSGNTAEVKHYTMYKDADTAKKRVDEQNKEREKNQAKDEEMMRKAGKLSPRQEAQLRAFRNASLSQSAEYSIVSVSIDLTPFLDDKGPGGGLPF